MIDDQDSVTVHDSLGWRAAPIIFRVKTLPIKKSASHEHCPLTFKFTSVAGG